MKVIIYSASLKCDFSALTLLQQWDQTLSDEEHQDLQNRVEAALSSLTKQQEVLQGVYSTYIAPWTASNTQLELPTTGPLVEQANSKLSSIVKV